MEAIIISLFVLGYLAITLEHSLKIDKLIPALIMMAVMWAVISLGIGDVNTWFDSKLHSMIDGFSMFSGVEKTHILEGSLVHHLGKTAEILVFLIGAMTIVEIIDYFDGFATINKFVRSRSKRKILWLFSGLAFFLSAIIDNLTATIVLISILQKLIADRESRLMYVGMIVIASNAGGAWSPIGDVTTTMLWIGNKVSAFHLVEYLLLPSMMCLAVPLLIASFMPTFRGRFAPLIASEIPENPHSSKMLYLGLGAIVFVPIFKTITHLPPYVGMMLSLGVVAAFAEFFSLSKFSMSSVQKDEHDHTTHGPVHQSLSKIELPSILFFLGILMAVAALESMGLLFEFATAMRNTLPMVGTELPTAPVSDLVVILLGFSSSVIDNVPLVAASLGMFAEPMDSPIWHFIAYAAGTGGSMLVIGSAAGVVAMGMENINFFWYLKKIAWLALLGFLAGALVFVFMRSII